jgi:hypothetical protein
MIEPKPPQLKFLEINLLGHGIDLTKHCDNKNPLSRCCIIPSNTINPIHEALRKEGARDGFAYMMFPERDVHPVDRYGIIDAIIKNVFFPKAQWIFVTQCPIIAAQFYPWERRRVGYDEGGLWQATEGIAPIGARPDSLLSQDFAVENLLGFEGRAAIARLIELKGAIKSCPPGDKREEMARELMEISMAYSF